LIWHSCYFNILECLLKKSNYKRQQLYSLMEFKREEIMILIKDIYMWFILILPSGYIRWHLVIDIISFMFQLVAGRFVTIPVCHPRDWLVRHRNMVVSSLKIGRPVTQKWTIRHPKINDSTQPMKAEQRNLLNCNYIILYWYGEKLLVLSHEMINTWKDKF